MRRHTGFKSSIIIAASLFPAAANAQDDGLFRQPELLIESSLEAQSDESAGEAMIEEMEQQFENPIDLNKARRGDLSGLAFLSPEEIRRLLDARRTIGRFVSWEQAQSLTGIDDRRMAFLKRACYLSRPGRAAPAKAQEPDGVTARLRSRLQRDYPLRKGFRNGAYAGPPERLYNRLDVDVGRDLRAGVLITRDPGETSTADRIRFALTADRRWMFDRLLIGDFNISQGQGVLLWRPSGFSKGGDIMNAVRHGSGSPSPALQSSGMSFRGAAFRAVSGIVSFAAFAGRRTMDGALDSATGLLVSIDESGLHRTVSELNKRSAASEDIAGARAGLSMRTGGVDIAGGISGYICRFSAPLNAVSPWAFGGARASALGFEFSAGGGCWSVSAEAGRLQNGRFGGAAAVSMSPSGRLRAAIVFRLYPEDFAAPHGHAFGEANGRTQNEHGVYFGLAYRLSRSIELRAYFDQFRFPAPTYFVDVPSSGSERFLELSWDTKQKTELRFRLRHESKDAGFSAVDIEGRGLRAVARRRAAGFLVESRSYPLKDAEIRLRIDCSDVVQPCGLPRSRGLLLMADLRLSPFKWMSIDGRLALYDTDSWDGRIYAYERDLPGVASNPALYGQGMLAYVLLGVSPFKGLEVAGKISRGIRYGEREIGSGNDAVEGDAVTKVGAGVEMRL